jgi:nitrous oxide reductase
MSGEQKERSDGRVSRRKFIATTGVLAAAGGLLASRALSEPAKQEAPKTPAAGKWPWVKLDPQEAAEKAFKTYHAKGG